jgi:hypothetical protein
MDYANYQTRLPFCLVLVRPHQEIALGVYGLVGPPPQQVTLRGPLGAFPAVNNWHVAMMLTWPWWSLEGSCGCIDLATLLTEAFL